MKLTPSRQLHKINRQTIRRHLEKTPFFNSKEGQDLLKLLTIIKPNWRMSSLTSFKKRSLLLKKILLDYPNTNHLTEADKMTMWCLDNNKKAGLLKISKLVRIHSKQRFSRERTEKQRTKKDEDEFLKQKSKRILNEK